MSGIIGKGNGPSVNTRVSNFKNIDVSSEISSVDDRPVLKKHKPNPHVALPSFQQLISILPENQIQSFTPNALVPYAFRQVEPQPQPAFIDMKLAEIIQPVENIKEKKSRVDQILKLQLKNLDLTPPSGWGKEVGTWQKGTDEELKSEFLTTISQDLKNRISKAMTLLISPTGQKYVYVNRKVEGVRQNLCLKSLNAYLKPEYEKVDWITVQSREIEWIKHKVWNSCYNPVSEEYARGVEKSVENSISKFILAAFACYKKS